MWCAKSPHIDVSLQYLCLFLDTISLLPNSKHVYHVRLWIPRSGCLLKASCETGYSEVLDTVSRFSWRDLSIQISTVKCNFQIGIQHSRLPVKVAIQQCWYWVGYIFMMLLFFWGVPVDFEIVHQLLSSDWITFLSLAIPILYRINFILV